MKKLIIITLSILALISIVNGFDVVEFACTDDIFANHVSQITDGLSYPMFPSDLQTAYMTNGVWCQFNFRQRAQKNNTNENVYIWSYSIPKAQAMSESDVAYISNKMSVAQTRFRYGSAEGSTAWLDTFSQKKPPELMTNAIPVPVDRTAYNDKDMQNDKLWFVSACTPNGWTADRIDWCQNWCDLKGWAHTEANYLKVEARLIKDEFVLASNPNVPIWVIKVNIKVLPNATLAQRDVFRSEIAAPFRPTIGFLRNSQQQVYMTQFGIARKQEE